MMTHHFDAAEISEMLLLAKSEELEESGQASCGHGMTLNQGQKTKKQTKKNLSHLDMH